MRSFVRLDGTPQEVRLRQEETEFACTLMLTPHQMSHGFKTFCSGQLKKLSDAAPTLFLTKL